MTTRHSWFRPILLLPLLGAFACNGIIGPEVGQSVADTGGASSGGTDAGGASASGGAGAGGASGAGTAGSTSAGGAGAGGAGGGGAAGSAGAPPTGPTPRIFYTDITHAPVSGGPNGGGALVTLYGADFGGAAGRVLLDGAPLEVVSWGGTAARGLTKVVVQLPAGTSVGAAQLQLVTSGNQLSNSRELVTTNKAIWYAAPSATGDGKAIATPMSLSDVGDVYAPGDLVYLLDGDYDYAAANCFNDQPCAWVLRLTNVPTASEPVQVMGYPGANPRFVPEAFGVLIDQNYARLGNVEVRLPNGAGVAVIARGRNVTLVGCDLSAAGKDQGANSGLAMTDQSSEVELVGNSFQGLFSGSDVFSGGSRIERYNEYRAVTRVVSIDPSAPLRHYGNHAIDTYQYAVVAAGGGSPAQIELFDNVVQLARYFVYQTASTASGDVWLRNNTVDSQCLAGADEDGLTLPIRLEANALMLTTQHVCSDEPPGTASLTFTAEGNHWGTLGAPSEDASPLVGDLALNADLMPGITSALCASTPKPAAPYDLDYLRNPRRSPSAAGAFECPE